MKSLRRASRGFTLMEVLVTVVLVSLAVLGTLGSIRSIQAAGVKAQTADLLERLASEKIGDLKLLQDPTTGGSDGDFTDRGYPDVTWALTDDASAITNLSQVTVTVTRGKESQVLTTLLYVRPQTTTTTTDTAGAATGAGT